MFLKILLPLLFAIPAFANPCIEDAKKGFDIKVRYKLVNVLDVTDVMQRELAFQLIPGEAYNEYCGKPYHDAGQVALGKTVTLIAGGKSLLATLSTMEHNNPMVWYDVNHKVMSSTRNASPDGEPGWISVSERGMEYLMRLIRLTDLEVAHRESPADSWYNAVVQFGLFVLPHTQNYTDNKFGEISIGNKRYYVFRDSFTMQKL